jgi:hypothetical protein
MIEKKKTLGHLRAWSEAKPIGERVGPQLNDTLTKQLNEMNKTLSFTGVDYPADYIGFLVGGSPRGSLTMAQQASSTNRCAFPSRNDLSTSFLR